MIIAFDFDGTITKHNTYPTCEQLREGIVNCIRQLCVDGHYIIIFTCRDTGTQEQLDAYNTMVNYLRNNKIPYHVINKNIDNEELNIVLQLSENYEYGTKQINKNLFKVVYLY